MAVNPRKPPHLTLTEFARRKGIPVQLLTNNMQTGPTAGLRHGRVNYYNLPDLQAWLLKLKLKEKS